MNEAEVIAMSTSSEIGYIPISESSDAVISVDNLPDYSGGFFGITFAIGIMTGLFLCEVVIMEDVNFFAQNIFCFTGGFIGGLFLGYIALCINAIWLSALKFFK